MATILAQQPTVIKAETMPASPNYPPVVTPEKNPIMQMSGSENILSSDRNNEDSLEASPSLSTEAEEAVKAVEAASSVGFFGSLRKKMRSAAGIDSQFVNPYLGKGHSVNKVPPYGQEQTSPSPAAFPTSSMMPPPSQPLQQYPFQPQLQPPWSDNFYQQQQAVQMMTMMNGMSPLYGAEGMPMMNPGISACRYYGSVPPQHRGPGPFLYPSNSLLEYSYSMHDPYIGAGRPYYGAGYHPFAASAMPVQDKRLLPERNYVSAVKDIWQTNLQ